MKLAYEFAKVKRNSVPTKCEEVKKARIEWLCKIEKQQSFYSKFKSDQPIPCYKP